MGHTIRMGSVSQTKAQLAYQIFGLNQRPASHPLFFSHSQSDYLPVFGKHTCWIVYGTASGTLPTTALGKTGLAHESV